MHFDATPLATFGLAIGFQNQLLGRAPATLTKQLWVLKAS